MLVPLDLLVEIGLEPALVNAFSVRVVYKSPKTIVQLFHLSAVARSHQISGLKVEYRE